jgi:hypothetical protein
LERNVRNRKRKTDRFDTIKARATACIFRGVC